MVFTGVFVMVAQRLGCAPGLQLGVFACLSRLRAQSCVCKSDSNAWLPGNGAGVRFFGARLLAVQGRKISRDDR
jgi:hypothetical protein